MQDSSSYTPTQAAQDLYKCIYHQDRKITKLNASIAKSLMIKYVQYHRSDECSTTPDKCLFEQRLSSCLDLLTESIHIDLNILASRSKWETLKINTRLWIKAMKIMRFIEIVAAVASIISFIYLIYSC